jgi:MFS family permease
MMSLINTNSNYLSTMGIEKEEDPIVGVIVSVYYLGCAVGAVIGSYTADQIGRKSAIFIALATATLGNILMFISGLGMIPDGMASAMVVMFCGRIVMGEVISEETWRMVC